ncbi:MAG: hypothetical protein ABI793_14755 [Flavobacterium sp.]
MKKLSLQNVKVMKMTKEEKKAIAGGYWTTSQPAPSGPYISWCNGCAG